MISSMTAFGRTQKEESGYLMTVEIRTLNSRGLDVVLRLPKNFIEFEDSCRKLIGRKIKRGRIEVFVQIESTKMEQKAPPISTALSRYYWEQLGDLHRQLPGSDPPRFQDLLRIPHIYETREEIQDRETLGGLLACCVEEALARVLRMRALEGDSLLKDCTARLEALRQELATVESRKDLVLIEYQQKIRDRVRELLEDTEIDEARLLQEVAYLAERSDINEEMVRLRSHIDQMSELLAGNAPSDGRRLDFLTQELHREANTIGVKTGDLEAIQAVVRMKSEIGKLKEQVQNIE